MKTDRRHDLHTNELADYLGKIVAKIKPYTNHIVAGVFAVLLIAVVWSLTANYFSGNEDTAWKELRERSSSNYVQRRIEIETKSLNTKIQKLDAQILKLFGSKHDGEREELNTERAALEAELSGKKKSIRAAVRREIERIADDFADDPVGWAAALQLADAALRDGVNNLYPQQQSRFSAFRTPPDLVEARKRLDEAIWYYKLVKQRTSDPLLKQRAQFDLARAFETSAEVDKDAKPSHLEEAKKEYENLAASGSVYSRLARRRLDMLSADRFHSWFKSHLDSLANSE